MAMPDTRTQREQSKFEETSDGKTAVRTISSTASSSTAESKQITVTTAGTAVAIALGSTSKFTIRANDDNTGNIGVGDSTVTMSNGYILTPGESTPIIYADDSTSAMYVDAATDGDGVSIIYEV